MEQEKPTLEQASEALAEAYVIYAKTFRATIKSRKANRVTRLKAMTAFIEAETAVYYAHEKMIATLRDVNKESI